MDARSRAIKALEKRLGAAAKQSAEKTPARLFYAAGAHEKFLSGFPQEKIFTNEALRACINALLQGGSGGTRGNGAEDKVYACLSGFVKAFEVSKKVFSEYAKGFRVSDARGSHDKTENYATLSVACLLFFQSSGNLKFLNAALKLDDFLCSLEFATLSDNDAGLCLCALRLEKPLAQKLFSEKGVALWH